VTQARQDKSAEINKIRELVVLQLMIKSDNFLVRRKVGLGGWWVNPSIKNSQIVSRIRKRNAIKGSVTGVLRLCKQDRAFLSQLYYINTGKTSTFYQLCSGRIFCQRWCVHLSSLKRTNVGSRRHISRRTANPVPSPLTTLVTNQTDLINGTTYTGVPQLFRKL
jgi:hypothetical protein